MESANPFCITLIFDYALLRIEDVNFLEQPFHQQGCGPCGQLLSKQRYVILSLRFVTPTLMLTSRIRAYPTPHQSSDHERHFHIRTQTQFKRAVEIRLAHFGFFKQNCACGKVIR
jgi:hypothetical protein